MQTRPFRTPACIICKRGLLKISLIASAVAIVTAVASLVIHTNDIPIEYPYWIFTKGMTLGAAISAAGIAIYSAILGLVIKTETAAKAPPSPHEDNS